MRRAAALVLALAAMGCATAPTHHLQRMNGRRTPRAAACDHPELFIDRGPAREREVLAVVTAECTDRHPEQCRAELQRAGCDADADAVTEARANPLRGGRIRMVGYAVEWRP